MNRADLEEEMWQAVRNVRTPHINRLLSLGCTASLLASLGSVQPPFGVANVTWLAGGFYEPDDEGEPAVITPVFDYARDCHSAVDLVAWRTASPRRWAMRRGIPIALGDHLLDRGEAVRVVETPLDWLGLGGKALCVLDWDAPPAFWSRVRGGPRLILGNAGTRAKIANACARSVIMPQMEVLRAA